MLKIGNYLFAGRYEETMGTALFFKTIADDGSEVLARAHYMRAGHAPVRVPCHARAMHAYARSVHTRAWRSWQARSI